MKEVEIYGSVTTEDGEFIKVVSTQGDDITHLFRDDMIKIAYKEGQALKYNSETGRGKRIDSDQVPAPKTPKKKKEIVNEDPVLAFISNAPSIKPDHLEITDIKWKYLIRSAVRGKNIMMVGPAGCGKTLAAKALVNGLDRPDFYFNLGATQDPRATLIGNVQFDKEKGTHFSESLFVKAIQTPNAVILMDELSRAHPDAWNILMTVLDQGQRYLRLDEAEDQATIKVADGVTFIATANIGNEYTATRVMDRALLDRFIIVEMDVLKSHEEQELLSYLFPQVDTNRIEAIADIVGGTRIEINTETPRISTAISTRNSVEMASLIYDGFSLEEAAEVCIYPQYNNAGGLDSERTFVKQLVQKWSYDPNNVDSNEELFNVEEEVQA